MGRLALIIGGTVGVAAIIGGIILFFLPRALPLDALLVQPGDLPAGYSSAQIRDTAPGMFADVPPSTKMVYQELEARGQEAGGITLFLYEDDAVRTKAYDVMVSGLSERGQSVQGIGERASEVHADADSISLGFVYTDLLFERCGTIAYIRFAMMDRDAVTAYAKRLDARLQANICP